MLLLPWRAIQLRHPAYVTYVHRDRCGRIAASLVIKPTPGPTWTIADHITRHPGTGAGRHLRDQLLPHLLDVADEHGITGPRGRSNQRAVGAHLLEHHEGQRITVTARDAYARAVYERLGLTVVEPGRA